MVKIDVNDLYTKFYLVINNIIYDIHLNENITQVNNMKIFDLPLTICLGGSGFIQYNNIFKNENLIDKIKIESKDYDISFSFGTNNITNQIINIIV